MKRLITLLIGFTMLTFIVPAQVLDEGFEGGTLPAGWTQEYEYGTVDWAYQNGGEDAHPANAHTGSYNAFLYDMSYLHFSTKLVTSALDLSAGGYLLKFWHTQDYWGSDADKLDVYYKEGAAGSWISLATYDYEIVDWTQETITLPTTSSEVYIAFDGSLYYGYGVCLDDVVVETSVLTHDIGVTVAKPTFVNSGDSYTPKVSLHNYGTETESDFDIIVSIDDGTKADVYRDTVFLTGQALSQDEDITVTLDNEWATPVNGTYTITAKVVLASDENAANDELVDNCIVGEGDIAYCWTYNGDISRGPSYFFLQGPEIIYEIAEVTSGYYYSGAWANNNWYMGNYTSKELVIVDPADGSITVVGNFGNPFISGLAYDNSTSIMYGISDQKFYTINFATGAATEVGNCNISGSAFGNLACSEAGVLYSVNRDDDALYSIDKATGAATIVGSGLGITIGTQAQDMEYDLKNDILYIASYEGSSISNLRTIDVATGLASDPIGAFPGGPQVCGLAIPNTDPTDILTYSVPGATNIVIDDVAHTVDLDVPNGTNVTTLVADFTLVGTATAVVDVTPQVSGTTANDFTSPVTYTVTGDDASVQDWIVTVTILLSAEADILTYSLPGQTGCVVGAGVINVDFPYGTDLSNLIADFTLSTGASADIGGTPQVSGVTANDFTSMVQYKVTAKNGTDFNYWNVNAANAPNDSTDILTFSIPGASEAVIDDVTHTVDLNMPVGTDVTALVADFTLSDEASALVLGFPQTSGVSENDFTNPVIYAITAGDNVTEQDWTVTVHLVNNSTDILTYSIPGATEAAIDDINHTVNLNVPLGTDVTALVANFTLSGEASALVLGSPQTSGVSANDFTSPVIYAITAGDNVTEQDWTVTVHLVNDLTDILTYSIPGATNIVINDATHTVDLDMSSGTNVIALVATFTLSSGATADLGGTPQVSGTTANDFTNPVTYTVTAENNVTVQDWVVTVSILDGIDELSGNEFKIYPNPSNGIFNIDVAEFCKLEILDMTGKTIDSQVLNNKSNKVVIPQAGIYLLRLTNSNTTITHRIIIE